MSIIKAAAIGAILATTNACSSSEGLTRQEWDERYRHPVATQLSPEESAEMQDISGETRVHLHGCIADTEKNVVNCEVTAGDAPPMPFPLSM